MKVAIIGCGLIGQKRAKSLGTHELIIAADNDITKAKNICQANNAKATDNWQEAIAYPGVDIVIVATTNDWLTPIALYALERGRHILIEKPGARSVEEINPLLKESRKSNFKVKVGFNLRFHPAIRKAKEIIESGEAGELMFIRGKYGHGGRVGYEKEWRADPKVSGGGELIDQGVHLIDLARWFLGDFEYINGFVRTYFWSMPVEDNAFIAMRTKKQQMAWLQVSCTEWKNLFCLEIYGKNAKLQIDGLGGSYGTEKLTYYKMSPQMGPPETHAWDFPGEDKSWKIEFDDFIDSIINNKPINGGVEDAYKTLAIVQKIYRGEHK